MIQSQFSAGPRCFPVSNDDASSPVPVDKEPVKVELLEQLGKLFNGKMSVKVELLERLGELFIRKEPVKVELFERLGELFNSKEPVKVGRELDVGEGEWRLAVGDLATAKVGSGPLTQDELLQKLLALSLKSRELEREMKAVLGPLMFATILASIKLQLQAAWQQSQATEQQALAMQFAGVDMLGKAASGSPVGGFGRVDDTLQANAAGQEAQAEMLEMFGTLQEQLVDEITRQLPDFDLMERQRQQEIAADAKALIEQMARQAIAW